MKIIYKWWRKPARPWQFWLPQSGRIGGIIFGLTIFGIIIIILSFI